MSESEFNEKHYRETIASLAEDIHAECDEACVSYTDYDRLYEIIENNRFVFMYGGALAVLQYSRNDDAIFDVEDEPFNGCKCMGDVWVRAAFHALKQDVLDYLDDANWGDPELTYTAYITWTVLTYDDDGEVASEEEEEEENEFNTLSEARTWVKKFVATLEEQEKEGLVDDITSRIEDSELDEHEVNE